MSGRRILGARKAGLADPVKASTGNHPALMVETLGRSYATAGGPLVVLDDISFSVPPGSSLAVVGPSGSGKSTLLGLIAGLDRPSTGRVVIDGTDLAGLSSSLLASFRGQRIGYVFQSFRLLPSLSALENVSLPLDLAGAGDARARALTWLERVGLGQRQRHLPAQLSGGEQQRVALARALVTAPALLVADEPTGNLDGQTGAAMADLLFSHARDSAAALVVVTHDERLAERADRTIRLQDGRLVTAP